VVLGCFSPGGGPTPPHHTNWSAIRKTPGDQLRYTHSWKCCRSFREGHWRQTCRCGGFMFEGLFQPMHLLIIFFIALLVFGPKKLPELGKGLGEGIRALKAGMKDGEAKAEDKTDNKTDNKPETKA
jgi:sec-independent protein translocase protein TatA